MAKKNPVVPIASVGADGHPHITPVGSLWLHRTEPRGLYLELFTKQLPKNLAHDPRFTMLFVDSGAWTWLRALVRGTFRAPVGVRLHGVAGPPRASEPHEVARFQRLVKPVSWTKGHDILWSRLPRVRDLTFTGATPIRLGAMTKGPELRLEASVEARRD
ncbi:MAG: pyridoxamine 5'-phosphate oxidase family protein [Polyangiales bacterium]